MFSKPPREVSGRLPARRHGIAALAATLIALLATMPTAAALASPGPSGSGASIPRHSTPAVGALTAPGELLPAGELEKLLSNLPLDDLGIAQLAHQLAELEGVSVLAELKLGLLSHEELGTAGLEESLRKAIEQLGPGAKLGELANVKDLLPALEAALEGKLGGLLGVLLGALPGGGPELESALGSLNLEQLVGSLLSSAKPQEQLATELSNLAGGLLGELGTEGKLEGLLGSEPTGGFTLKSVREVAEELKSTPEAVSGELGESTQQLPETATMLTAPLATGKLAGLAPAVKGLALGLLGGGSPEGAGKGSSGEGNGNGGSGEGKSSGGAGEGSGKGTGEGNGSGSGGGGGESSGSGAGGGQGGPGGTGSGGPAGTTTILLTLPGAPSTQSAAARSELGKVAVLSHRVRGHLATIVLHVPAAGTVILAGRGLRTVRRQAAKAERLTLNASLAKAATASLRRGRHHRLPVKLEISFKSASGSSSSAAVTVIFR
jgi:hypothetical protein